MSQRLGINRWIQQRLISGCRVAFDRRRTHEVDDTRDPVNRKQLERTQRRNLWRIRQRSKEHKQAA
jgi:hypothetical protein